ncbi:MAG: hypothetical protein HC880_06040 [Bacteroidia bacterium]|nr:hypothetical protein [Bacteroidia bacterium]
MEDIQTVAHEELNRDLSDEEIKFIENNIGERIHWYDIIAQLIQERIGDREDDIDVDIDIDLEDDFD